MSNREILAEQYEETRLIIEELLEDGSDPEAFYSIEHHFASDNFEDLEKAAVAAYKLSYDVSDAEELELDDGSVIFCCDAIREMPLDADLINEQVEQLVELADLCNVTYDGWGTYFVDPNGEDDEEYDDDDGDDDQQEVRH
jgi:regulator of RNase E activity RraB